MKKSIFICILACVSFISIDAQDITKDFFKSLPKNGVKSDSIKNSVERDSIPYINPNNPNGSSNRIKNNQVGFLNSDMIERIQKSMFILRQDYCLYDKRDDEYYGYDNNDFFGTTYSIGLKCKGFNILSDVAVRPWEYDDKYDKFKSKKLVPEITRSKYRFINDSTSHRFTPSDTVIIKRKTIRENLYYTSGPFVGSQEGFILNTQDTCKTGNLVWIVVEKGNIESADMKVSLELSSFDTEMFGSVTVTPPANKSVIGGLFITKSQGTDIPFYLTGLITKKDNSWVVEFPFKGFKEDGNESLTKLGKLTRIKKPKEKKRKRD